MNTQKLLDTYMLVGAGLSRVKYEIFQEMKDHMRLLRFTHMSLISMLGVMIP